MTGGEGNTMDIPALLRSHLERVNARELAARRDYHAYLVGRGDEKDTLEEHIAKYASLARIGEPATPHDIEALQALSQPPLPAELVDFYRTCGSFRGGHYLHDCVIHAPSALLDAHRRPRGEWEVLPSMGLAAMVRWAWGNDRFEFEPDQGGLAAAEVAALDRAYSAIGWRVVASGEGFEFLYFDAHGRFGRLFFHQDAFDELYEDSLQPMLAASPATQDLGDALRDFLAGTRGPSAPA